MHQILWEDASRPCGDEHVTKSQHGKLIRVNVRTIIVSVSVTITDIWIKFDIELKHHTNMTECAKLTTWKSKMAAGAILDFGKYQ